MASTFTADHDAASPLVVLGVAIGVAVIVTVLVYAAAFDRPETAMQVVASGDGGSLTGFTVTAHSKGLSWGDVSVVLLDRAGRDRAATYLDVPGGDIGVGDRIDLRGALPAGQYELRVRADHATLARIAVTV